MLRYRCLQCHEVAETSDGELGARWLDSTQPMPCGHIDADFQPNPELLRVEIARPVVRGTLPN